MKKVRVIGTNEIVLNKKATKTCFITDLDRTIIHSKHKGYKCVEKIGDKEITYMTDEAYKKLQNLLMNNNFMFIPCTMRNINQIMRIDFLREYNPQIIICSNGAQIYINGELDCEWNNYMIKVCNLSTIGNNIEYLKELQIKLKDVINVIEVRNIEDFYITVKCYNSVEAQKFYEIIKDNFESDLKVLRIEAKIFIMHEKIDKVYAVDYIINKFGLTNIITAGDSEVDRRFTSRGICILPKHSSFTHRSAIRTQQSKIESTEEILDEVLKIVGI